MKKADRESLASLMKAMGHPVRVQILQILGERGECLSGDLSDRLPVAASTTSQHLSMLKEAGLISGTIDGPRRCYCVNQKTLDRARALLGELRGCC